MTRFYLVRNGRTEDGAGFSENPRLDEVGRVQAEAVASLLGSLPRMLILTSPQKRALESAKPLADRWLINPVVDESVTLMPLPNMQPSGVFAWLTTFMKGTWHDAPVEQAQWRQQCLEKLIQLKEDTVVFSHFVVVNMFAGAALSDDRVTVFQPDNGSITIIEIMDGKLSLVERGRQASTRRL